MKNILKNIFLVGTVSALVASCDLELRPTSAIVFDENKPFFTNASDIESFANGVMASYRAVQYGSYTQSTEVMCDGFNALISYGNNYGSIHRTDATFTTSDSYTETMWANHYAVIKNYNIAIEQAEYLLDEDSEYYNEELVPYAEYLKGIAQFCRASSYLTLARHFGPDYDENTASEDLCVPLVLKFDVNEKPSRATVADVYSQIDWDLTEAAQLLEGKVLQGTPRSADITIDAINALQARYYLDIDDYSSAAKMADAVIASQAGYKLASSASEMLSSIWTAATSRSSSFLQQRRRVLWPTPYIQV